MIEASRFKGGSLSVQHAVGSANQAQSVLNGIDPQFFNKGSRFGGGFYVGADSNTIVAELAEHGNTAKYAISYDINLSGQKVLDWNISFYKYAIVQIFLCLDLTVFVYKSCEPCFRICKCMPYI